MKTVILNSESNTDLRLLMALAKKIGVKSRILSESQIEEMGLVNSIKSGRTNTFVDTSTFFQRLRK